jgi:glycosyl transferase family 25
MKLKKKHITRKRKRIYRGGNKNHVSYPPDSIKKYISNVIYINLDKRTDRKAEIEKELKIFDSKQVHRISAVSEPEHPYLGCTKSHLQALKMAKDRNWDNVLIMEDDAIWTNIEKGYPIFERLVKEPYDVIMLGGTYGDYDHTTYRVKKALTTSSYLVNKSYYDTIIQKLDEVINGFNPETEKSNKTNGNIFRIKVSVAIDAAVFCPLQQKHKWFIVVPALVIQRPGYSNIEKETLNYKNVYLK